MSDNNNTQNPAGSPRITPANDWQRFEKLAKKVTQVPKTEARPPVKGKR